MKFTARKWSWIGATIAWIVLVPKLAIALTATEVSQLAKSVTVLIEGQDTGSGVLIQKDGTTYTVLTAKHVVEHQDNYQVVTPTGQRYSIQYSSIIKLPDLDLALVEFSTPDNHSYVNVGNSDALVEGMTVYVAGFPGQGSTISSLAYNFTAGQLTAHASEPRAGGYALVYTNKTLPGMSGGPVFNPEGQLVGIHGAADGQSQSLEKLNNRVFVKTGFNLGIPINTFLQAGDPAVKVIASARPIGPEGSRPAPIKPQSAQGKPSSAAQTVAVRPAPRYESGASNYFLEAMTQYQLGDLTRALTLSTQAIQASGRFAPAYSLRGSIHYIQQNLTGALADFTQAVQLNDQLAPAYLGRGLTHSALGRPDQAIADYTQAIQLSGDALAYYNRGVVHLNQGDRANALQDLQKSADIALANHDQGEYQRAVEALDIASRDCRQSINRICDR